MEFEEATGSMPLKVESASSEVQLASIRQAAKPEPRPSPKRVLLGRASRFVTRDRAKNVESESGMIGSRKYVVTNAQRGSQRTQKTKQMGATGA